MRRVLMLSAIAVTFVLGLGSQANAQSVPPGSYQQTCNNIDFRNDVLAANCQDSSGHWQSALLRDVQGCRSDIINDDGSLRCSRGVSYQVENHAGLPNGVYTQSCQDIRIHGDDLQARCPTASGDWKNAKLDDYNKCHGDIVNDNGKLRCIVTPGYQAGYTTEVAVGVVAGPYTQTCKDIKSHDNNLEARCQAKNGEWHKTSLDDFQGCHGQIVNEDGYLHCIAVAGFVGNAPYGTPVASYQNGLQGGSYTQSCDAIHLHGNDLEARCQSRDGDSHNTKLSDFQTCKSEIINDDGKLRCEK